MGELETPTEEKEEKYNELQRLLENSMITIDKAINITETEDFKKINSEKVAETMEKFAETLKNITNGINKLFESSTLKIL